VNLAGSGWPQSFHAGPLNITVQEDEPRRAIRGRVASIALVDQLNGHPTPAGSIDIVMLIGASIRQEGQGASRELCSFVPSRLLTLPGESYINRSNHGAEVSGRSEAFPSSPACRFPGLLA
jgi:hypothetical protein